MNMQKERETKKKERNRKQRAIRNETNYILTKWHLVCLVS